MTAIRQQPNVKNGQPALDFTRPFMDDKHTAISAVVCMWRVPSDVRDGVVV
jgi:hypothetical protein